MRNLEQCEVTMELACTNSLKSLESIYHFQKIIYNNNNNNNNIDNNNNNQESNIFNQVM